MVTDYERLEAAVKLLKHHDYDNIAEAVERAIDQINKCKQEAANERKLSEEIVAEREELYAKCEEQEMRYQTFVSEAVSNIKIRENTIARQSAKIQTLESTITRLMNGTNGYV